jgi:hypothetical protein
MVALMALHISHGGQPSHVSQSLRSQIPSSNLSMRWMSVMLPARVIARSIVELVSLHQRVLLTHSAVNRALIIGVLLFLPNL